MSWSGWSAYVAAMREAGQSQKSEQSEMNKARVLLGDLEGRRKEETRLCPGNNVSSIMS